MGIDNMLAVGAASHGNLFRLLFGLILPIPPMLFPSCGFCPVSIGLTFS